MSAERIKLQTSVPRFLIFAVQVFSWFPSIQTLTTDYWLSSSTSLSLDPSVHENMQILTVKRNIWFARSFGKYSYHLPCCCSSQRGTNTSKLQVFMGLGWRFCVSFFIFLISSKSLVSNQNQWQDSGAGSNKRVLQNVFRCLFRGVQVVRCQGRWSMDFQFRKQKTGLLFALSMCRFHIGIYLPT